MRNLYICHAPEDRALKEWIMDWVNKGQLGPDWVAPRTGDDAPRPVAPGGPGGTARPGGPGGQMGAHLYGADAMILIAGDRTHEHDSINEAVNHVLTQRKRLIIVRAPGTTGPLPRRAEGLPVTPLQPQAMRAALAT